MIFGKLSHLRPTLNPGGSGTPKGHYDLQSSKSLLKPKLKLCSQSNSTPSSNFYLLRLTKSHVLKNLVILKKIIKN